MILAEDGHSDDITVPKKKQSLSSLEIGYIVLTETRKDIPSVTSIIVLES